MPVFLLFFLIWILLSGKITLAVCLTGVAVSALFCLFDRKVLGHAAPSAGKVFGRLGGSLRYLCFLFLEILKAGLVVMKLVFTKGRDMNPELIYFHTGLETNEAKVALANSITLTAGTITVQVRDDLFCIHTLDRPLAEGIEKSEFERRLRKLEK